MNIVHKFAASYHISYNQDYFCCVGGNAKIYNRNGQLISVFKNIKHPNCSCFTSGGNLIVKSAAGSYLIYDLNRMALMKVISPRKKKPSTQPSFRITADGKYIIDFSYVFPTSELMIIDVETEERTFFDLGLCRGGTIFSSETELKFYVITNCAESIHAGDVSILEFYELTYDSKRFHLQKVFVENGSKAFAADYKANKFVLSDYSNTIKLFNLQEKSQTSFEYPCDGVLYDLSFSKNGRFVALAEAWCIYVYDVLKKECIHTYPFEYGCFVDFFDDDTKLLIGTWKKGYCVDLTKTQG